MDSFGRNFNRIFSREVVSRKGFFEKLTVSMSTNDYCRFTLILGGFSLQKRLIY